MASKLILHQYSDLPPHPEGDFDHGDVALSNGYVFIANTAAGTVEVVWLSMHIDATRRRTSP
jgi:hypothetical protein